MTRIGSGIWVSKEELQAERIFMSKEELEAEAEAANRLAADLALLISGKTFSQSALQKAPTFVRALYVPKTVFVCMGQLRVDAETTVEMTHTEEVVVDGSDRGWVLTRRGLFAIEKLLGTY